MRLPLTFWGFLFMKFLEKDLEQIIFESGRDSLREKGLSIEGKLFRQLRIGNYGIADLVEFTRPSFYRADRDIFIPGVITVYELKKEHIGIASFLQALNYVKGIQSYLHSKKKEKQYIINLVLIGRSIDATGSFCFITDMLGIESFCNEPYSNGSISFITYNYTINGLEFTSESGYRLTNEGF
jgi:hypothetical protein